MRKIVSFFLALWMALTMVSPSLADAEFLPQLSQWELDALPWEARLAISLDAHMPFDDERTEQLSRLLSHVAMKLRYQGLNGEVWKELSLLVDDQPAMTMTTRETEDACQLQLSYLPQETFVGQSLLDEGDLNLYGLQGNELALLDDLLIVLENAEIGLPDYMTEKKVSEKVKNMGTAKLKQTFTIPKGDVGELGALLAGLCPEGKVKTFLSSLIFSGKQSLVLWKNSLGEIIRVDYSGQAGMDEADLRKVTLTWKLRRDDEQVRDSLTLKTPRVKGSGRDNVVLERTLAQTSGTDSTLDITFKYEKVAGGDKTVLSGEVDLESKGRKGETSLTGSVEVKQQLPGSDTADRTVLTPSLSFSGDTATPAVEGTLRWEAYRGKSIQERADINVQVNPAEFFDWELRENTVSLDETATQRILQGAETALVRRLVLVPQEDSLFLSNGLDDAQWQEIVTAAQNALQEEVAP